MFTKAMSDIMFNLGKIEGLTSYGDYPDEIKAMIDEIQDNLMKIMADKIYSNAEKIIIPEVTYTTGTPYKPEAQYMTEVTCGSPF